MDLKALLENEELLQKLAASVAWLVGVVVLRVMALRFVREQKWSTDAVRVRWHVRLGQIALLLLVLGFLLLWGSEIQAIALSAVAIAAALVLATKELFMCISGAIYRATADVFQVGDRVEHGTVRGDVISYGLFTFTVLEIGPNHLRTGRAVVVPNSLLLSVSLINETITDEFVLHSFRVPQLQTSEWQAAERILLEAAEEVTGEYRDTARRHMDVVSRKHGLPPATVDPRVTVMIPEAGKLDLVVRVPTPAHKKGAVEQSIVRKFLERSTAGTSAGTTAGT